MKIRYQFANGEISEVEVDERIGQELADLDRREYNGNRRETRRHVSLDRLEGFVDLGSNASTTDDDEFGEMIRQMWDSLLPSQQALIRQVVFEDRSIVSVARAEGVNESAIRNRLRKAYARAKKNLR